MNSLIQSDQPLDIGALKSDSVFQRGRTNIAPRQPIQTLDIELTNHCNAQCYFCPRELVDQTGFMEQETFQLIINQAAELNQEMMIGSCGHGESIMHPLIGEFIQYATARGIPYALQTNGSMLNQENRRLLFDAGLQRINISISAMGELYNKMYQLDFDQVVSNIKSVIVESQGQCEIGIYIVQTDQNAHLISSYKDFWINLGVDQIDVFPVQNRSGSIPYKQYDHSKNKENSDTEGFMKKNNFSKLCHSAILGAFIGWDGYHYLCSNDWEKRARIGHVKDIDLIQATKLKQNYIEENGNILCQSCDWYIKNRFNDTNNNINLIDELVSARKHEEKLISSLLK